MATFTTGIPWTWTLWGAPQAAPVFPTAESSSKDRITETQQPVPPKHRPPLAVVDHRLRRHLAAPLPRRQLPRELPAEVSCFLIFFWQQSKDRWTQNLISLRKVLKEILHSETLKYLRRQEHKIQLWRCFGSVNSVLRRPEIWKDASQQSYSMETRFRHEWPRRWRRWPHRRVVWWYVKLLVSSTESWYDICLKALISVLGCWFDDAL